MSHRAVGVIGIAHVVAAGWAFAVLLIAYGTAERLVVAQEASPQGLATTTVRWWGPDPTLTLAMSLLVVGAAAGVVGSLIQQTIIFAHRAAYGTLQHGFVWWYVLRPVWSGLLGAVAVIATNAGLISIGDDTTSAAGVTVLVTVGCLAGLFTDKVLDRLRTALGASDPAEPVAGVTAHERDLPAARGEDGDEA